jgi:hypothetical protein
VGWLPTSQPYREQGILLIAQGISAQVHISQNNLRVVIWSSKGSIYARAGAILCGKRSCPWKLSYGPLDCPSHTCGMHLIRNMYEGTLINLRLRKNKAKDQLESRMDLEEMNIRTEIHRQILNDEKLVMDR